MDFHEFCAAALSVHQLEALDRWEQHARSAYEIFEKDGNRAIVIDELASVCDTFYSIHVHFLIDKFGICSHLLYVTWSFRNWVSALPCRCMSFCRTGSGTPMGN
jgi:hypothetical protein